MRFQVRSQNSGSTVAAIAAKFRPLKPLHSVLGKRADIELRDHFLQRGGKSFWPEIRNSTAFESADETSARVVIADERFNQKVYGGTITPKEKKFLAIPAIAEAYGKPPGTFDFLVFRPTRRGGALVEAERTLIKIGRKKKDGTRNVKNLGEGWGGRVWFWLVKSVTQDKDAKALPERGKMEAALADEAEQFAERKAGK